MGGRKSTGIDAIWWVKRAQELGAGEILLNSMDADGTQQGFDLEMIKAVRKEVKIPIIASGGAGKASDFPPAIEAGADAVLAASIFHYGKVTIGEVKDAIKAAGYNRTTETTQTNPVVLNNESQYHHDQRSIRQHHHSRPAHRTASQAR